MCVVDLIAPSFLRTKSFVSSILPHISDPSFTMLSNRIVRSADVGHLQSKTPARSTRRVAFGDISNRKQPRNPTTTPAVKKSAAPPSKSAHRSVVFDIPSAAEPKQTLKDTKPSAKATNDNDDDDDDDDDVLGVEISPFSLSEAPVSGVQLNEDDWNEILAEEKEQLEWERDFAERRRAHEDEEFMKDIKHLERSIAAMHEQDGTYNHC